MRRSYLVAGAAAVLIGAILYGTGQNDIHTGQMRIAFFPNIAHAPAIVGMERGMFADSVGNVTQIDVRLFDSGPQAIEALFSGSIDMAYVGPGPAINGFLKSTDRNVRILAGAASGGSSMIVHPDAHISSPKDLAEKRIAAPQLGNTQDISLRTYLASNDLVTAEKGGSVTVLNIANPDTYTLFAKGEVDAAWMPEPWATILVDELGGHRLFHEEEMWPEGAFASVVIVAREQFVRENPEVVSLWLHAHSSTINWINQNPQDARDSFNRYVQSELGRPFPNHTIDEAMSNIWYTTDTLEDTIDTIALRAYNLGYLGRDGYNLDGIYMEIPDT